MKTYGAHNIILWMLCVAPFAYSSSQHKPAWTYRDREGYAVMSSALDEATKGWQDSVLRIESDTVSNADVGPMLDGCPKVPEEFASAERDFRWHLTRKNALRNGFRLRLAYVLMGPGGSDPRDVVYPRSGRMHDLLPMSQGSFFLSGVGFDSSGMRAAVYVGYECGGLCGSRRLHLLRKESGLWVEAKDINSCESVS
jgi:hypothetical protein